MTAIELETLKEQDKANTYIPHGNTEEADCIIGFSFGYLGETNYEAPGKSNEQLAAYIEQNLPHKPLILQFEINNALNTRSADLIISESLQKGAYLNSREIAERSLSYMKVHGWDTAIIVTHPAMEARNDALCSKLGIRTITPPGLEAIEYDKASAQPWTRDRDSWWEREEGAIQLCLEKGWL